LPEKSLDRALAIALEQLAVEMPRVPIDQYSTYIENNRGHLQPYR
jgi:hypothetical protein